MKICRISKIALLAALVLAYTSVLVACGQKQEKSRNAAAADTDTSYMIGYNTWGAGTPTFDMMAVEIDYALATYGLKGSRATDDHQADKELQNMQNFISADVDGIVMQISADPVLPQAAKACLNSKIPFALGIFIGDAAARAAIAANNPYYAGAVSANLYHDGYLMGKAAAAAGHKTAVLIGGNVGDHHFEQRIAGFRYSFVTEGGGRIIDEARCTSPAEGQEKATALLAAHRDVDCLYAMVGDYVTGSINAMDILGLNIPVYASNAGSDVVGHIKNGRVAAGGGGNDMPAGVAVALLINHLDGHPILNENGKAPDLRINPFLVTKDNVDDYTAMFYTPGTHPIAEDVLKSLLWRFNKDVSYKTFAGLTGNGLTLEAILSKRR
ncbi:MAG: sugar ABC transporter substrate-binding protein [Candidatus Accumulibacter sp.]|jgi:ABC-type sugar transport system substrate-binding protein|nr:sugar ABC transporter substrate-binding protein [Accumulibacter sp.]